MIHFKHQEYTDMKKLSISNKTRNKKNIIKAKLCKSFICMFCGYMFYEKINEDEGLLFVEKQDSRINTAILNLLVIIHTIQKY